MGNKFSEYVRDSAFHISLPKSQIRHLMVCKEVGSRGFVYEKIHMGSLQCLKEKGLLDHETPGDWTMTVAGNMIYDLLVHAGYNK